MDSSRENYINHLQHSTEPSIRYTIARYIDNQIPTNPEIIKLQEEIRRSSKINTLLAEIDKKHPYNKWQGVHWVLSLLAELNYPAGDIQLLPLMKHVYNWLFSEKFLKSIRTINGKVRRCASQEGNALYYSMVLNLANNKKTEDLVDRLIDYQWDDGGWNCDKSPDARHSSYNESLLPLRGLIYYYNNIENRSIEHLSSRKKQVQKTIYKAKEVFLKRNLYLSQSTGEEMLWRKKAAFTNLFFPYYWRYNILIALKVMNEGGFLMDPRCSKALDLLESKELPSGGFPAETRYYYSSTAKSGRSAVNWGGVKKNKANDWVSSEAYAVLNAAGRL